MFQKFERFLSRKISLRILIIILLFNLILLIQFGYLSTKSKTVNKIANIPETIKKILEGDHKDFILDDRFKNSKGLFVSADYSDNDYLLLSRYDGNLMRSVIEILDVKQKKKIATWYPDIDQINKISKLPRDIFNLEKDNNLKRNQIRHPYLNKDGSLIFLGNDYPLVKIDKCSKLDWIVDLPFHHSIEIDQNGDYWSTIVMVPQKVTVGLDENVGVDKKLFRDDAIIKISKEGKILFKKSIMEIFIENDLEHLIFPGESPTWDPIHINDVQPVLKTGKYFKKGDLFLSLRNLSMIVLYRPELNKIIWYKKYPWRFQHDVDILSEKQISVFNNKNLVFYPQVKNGKKITNYNNVLIYDFNKNEILNKYDYLFKKFQIKTPRQGLSEIIDGNKIFVEETDYGRILFIDTDGNKLFEYVNRAKDGNIYNLHWSRILNYNDYKSTIEILKQKICK
tara:strand:+ start:825 stop:2180 length:1356 start_codon:yes stop_codon:yes gene_type:complete